MSNAILTVKNLSFAYNNENVLEDVNMQVFDNRITAIFGSSGSGKSTLLNVFSLLFRELEKFRISGEVLFHADDKAIDILKLKKDFWEIRRKISYIAQTPNPLNTTIFKNVAFPLKITGISNKKVIRESVESALKKVNLIDEVKNRLHTSAFELSGGQKQKLCIARALVLNPDILLLDEPTSSLDTENKDILEELIIQLGKTNTIIFVSHDMDQIRKVANEVFECKNKTITKV